MIVCFNSDVFIKDEDLHLEITVDIKGDYIDILKIRDIELFPPEDDITFWFDEDEKVQLVKDIEEDLQQAIENKLEENNLKDYHYD